MKPKFAVATVCLLISQAVHAQWAVLDEKVRLAIEKINNVKKVEGVGSLKNLEDPVAFEKLDVDFSKLTSLTDADKKKYIGTIEDCGDEKLNKAHFEACVGLRNLRLQTLKQSQSVLAVLDKRRETIDKVITDARNNTNQESGIMQRYSFEIQGLQAQMQSDGMKLQILMDGYKQRERIYEMQMAEARRATDTRPPAIVEFGAVPFPSNLKAIR